MVTFSSADAVEAVSSTAAMECGKQFHDVLGLSSIRL
jgi:hypothetical protein